MPKTVRPGRRQRRFQRGVSNVDHTNQPPQRILSYCTGYGGIELGLERTGMVVQPIAYVEIEAWACWGLVKKIEAGLLHPAPVWTNLVTFPLERFRGRVDGFIGGYPCTPFSAAGKRKGESDPRHLWPWFAKTIRLVRPSWCFFENVEGHITKGLRNVLSDLGELGYRSSWGIFSASEVGLPHQRKRVFILAYRKCKGLEGWLPGRQDTKRQGEHGHTGCCGSGIHEERFTPARPGQPQEWWEPPRVITGEELGNTKVKGCRGLVHEQGKSGKQEGGHTDGTSNREEDSWEIESEVGGSIDGSPDWMVDAELYETYRTLGVSNDNRTDELRSLGNGVVPATAAKAFIELCKELNQ